MKKITFIDDQGTFQLEKPDHVTGLNFPIAGNGEIKSCVTPLLGGDCKYDQNTFVLEPESIENLHNNRSSRNFWLCMEDGALWSATGSSARAEADRFSAQEEDNTLTAGLFYHIMEREEKNGRVKSTVTSFVPTNRDVEIMEVMIKNTSDKDITFTPVAAIPIYGRSADNLRDHRHVTSLLHVIRTVEGGVLVKPKLSFDERGHQKNKITYFVGGVSGDGQFPVSYFPSVDAFLLEGGTFTNPRSLVEGKRGVAAGTELAGKEAMGGLVFADCTLKPQESVSYTMILGASQKEEDFTDALAEFSNRKAVEAALEKVKETWSEAVNVSYHTGDSAKDQYLRWINFQPILRRIYGCSFLPYHDYGKGGRGFRDLWQDCLALLIMNPTGVRKMLLDNFGGIRTDGTNATIIGTKPGEFVADRNGITRVWMDHGFWPFVTTKFYMNQTGDLDLFMEKTSYFKDQTILRGTGIDDQWNAEYGVKQKDCSGKEYQGTILEHILLELLCAFYEVGDHNVLRLRGADWNDACDMASENGESVAFSSAYAGALKDLAVLLSEYEKSRGVTEVSLFAEMAVLLEEASFDAQLSQSDMIEKKKDVLNQYCESVAHSVSDHLITVQISDLVKNLNHKAEHLMKVINEQEWVSDGKGRHWFNGYYDNNARQVEGLIDDEARMILTSQVFAIMSHTADEARVQEIVESANEYLYREEIGGYRLNTKFSEDKFDMGRMFGFAYGEKENGAVFSHMAVMFANALYQRGFYKEGYQALNALLKAAMNFEISGMYPGIPEYFNAEGRGLYPYLTGAASWFMLTMITECFGVKGEYGNLVVAPRLMEEQYDQTGRAVISLPFMERKFRITIENKGFVKAENAKVVGAETNGIAFQLTDGRLMIEKNELLSLNQNHVHEMLVIIGE